VAAPKAPLLDSAGKKSKDVALEESVFAAEVKKHLVHEAVRSEQNAQRAGTAATKSRGLVSGGRAKPWRQKGTGRARQGTIRAPQFTGGGHTFAKVPRTFVQKVNRKAAKAALRSALASHASEGTIAIISAESFDKPSTKLARSLV
jgi:large subunit ribosomal protein L4